MVIIWRRASSSAQRAWTSLKSLQENSACKRNEKTSRRTFWETLSSLKSTVERRHLMRLMYRKCHLEALLFIKTWSSKCNKKNINQTQVKPKVKIHNSNFRQELNHQLTMKVKIVLCNVTIHDLKEYQSFQNVQLVQKVYSTHASRKLTLNRFMTISKKSKARQGSANYQPNFKRQTCLWLSTSKSSHQAMVALLQPSNTQQPKNRKLLNNKVRHLLK